MGVVQQQKYRRPLKVNSPAKTPDVVVSETLRNGKGTLNVAGNGNMLIRKHGQPGAKIGGKSKHCIGK